MASIHREFEISSTPENAWAALRDVGKINELISFLGKVTVDGDHRVCELGDQGTLDELIVSVDDERKRLVYSILKSPFNLTHHSASMQVVPNSGPGARFIWTADLKPDAAAAAMSEVMDHAIESLKVTLR